MFFCGSQNHSVMMGILRGGRVDTSGAQKGSVDYVIICVSYYSHTLLYRSLCPFLSIYQAQTTDYIMRPHPCASVEQNKGTLPAEHSNRGESSVNVRVFYRKVDIEGDRHMCF